MKIKINNNPFLSGKFINIWLKYFANNAQFYNTKKELDITLIKKSFLQPLLNTGENFTNGMSYQIKNEKYLYQKSILIYDVPSYFNINNQTLSKRVKIIKVRQYGGALINLEKYTNIDDYLSKKFKAKKRAELRKFKRRLEICFDIEYQFYNTQINREEYNEIFETFYHLLNKRYKTKKVANRNLSKKFKQYYKELIYDLINDNKALLFVIRENGRPIAISLCFLSEEIVFYSIPVFDIDFNKFNLGHISILKLIEWSIDNQYKVFDFSKGDAIYKNKWITDNYNFEHHIIYDKYSMLSLFKAILLNLYFKLKQHLRDKKYNELLNKIKFKFSYNKTTITQKISIEEIKDNIDDKKFTKIYYKEINNSLIKKSIYDLLYTNSTHINDVSISQKNKEFLIRFNKKQYLIKLKNEK